MPNHDLILKGGRVLDPAQGIDGPLDVAFAGGKVSALDAALDPSRAAEVRDVSGLLVTPA